MCGLSAVITGTVTLSEARVFSTLMTLSNLRGYQGAGLIYGDKKGNYYYDKTLGTGVDIVNCQNFDDALKSKPSFFIGHTRWPTKGETVIENVHPHDCENVIGVHNGTMTSVNHTPIPHNASDSKMLFDAISEKGAKEALDKSWGAYALIYVDKNKDIIHIVRNNQRTLYIARGPNTVFVASERLFLEFALARENIRNFKIEPVPSDVLFSFSWGKKGGLVETETPLRPFVAASYTGTGTTPTSTTKATHTGTTPATGGKDRDFTAKTWRVEKQGNGNPRGALIQWMVVGGSYRYTFANGEVIVSNYDMGFRYEKTDNDAITSVPITGNKSVVPFRESPKSTGDGSSTTSKPSLDKETEVPLFKEALERVNKKKSRLPRPREFKYHETTPQNFVCESIFDELLSNGCSWCGFKVSKQAATSEEEALMPEWAGDNEYFCAGCKNLPDVREWIEMLDEGVDTQMQTSQGM